MDVKIEVKVEVGKKVVVRSFTQDWWDEMEIEGIANDIKEAIQNIE